MGTIPNKVNRRLFLATGLCSVTALCVGCGSADGKNSGRALARFSNPKEARFYGKLQGSLVQCHVCPRECVIEEGDRGFCRTRENRKGVLYSLVYGNIAALHVDPIEKKPLYHFLPGSQAYSLATAGCNMTCKFCQNWELSQSKPEDLDSKQMTPFQVAEDAAQTNSESIAYTYSEPTVFTEFVYDCALEGKKHSIHSVIISNGYICEEPLKKLGEVISAYKVDFKAFSKTFYHDVTGGERDYVLETIKRLKKMGIWMELVHLTIPTLNDGNEDFKAMGDWLMGEVGPDVPVHFTRFHPIYRLTNLPVTPVSTLERARNILMAKGIKYVYVGNVPGNPANSTYCPKCGAELIRRVGFSVDMVRMKKGACGSCGTTIPGVWT